MDNMTPRFSVPDVPTNDPALDREASEQKSRERDIAQYATWMSGKWAALRQNADIMGIMSCGPRAVAGMVGMMLSDMGARLDDVALVTADLVLVEIPREALPMVDEFKRRALRAALMTDAVSSLCSAVKPSGRTALRSSTAALRIREPETHKS